MNTPLKTVIQQLPKARQKRIQAEAQKQIITYQTLQELRKTLGFTQEAVAEKLGVNQVNISNLEKRKDMHISTLRKYVEAMGCTLEINIIVKQTNSIRSKKPSSTTNK